MLAVCQKHPYLPGRSLRLCWPACWGPVGVVVGGEHIITITSPTVSTPAGCSGTPIDKIGINVNLPSTVQVFGETFDVQQASGQSTYVITRAAVPCEYVLTATIKTAGERMIVGFGRTQPFIGDGGVEMGSVVVEQGDESVLGSLRGERGRTHWP